MTDTPEVYVLGDEPEPDEPDTGDDDTGDEDDDDDETEAVDAPEPQGHGPSPEEVERAFKKIETSFATYAKSVERNHPSFEADLIPCLLCPPAHPGFLNVHDAGRVPKEVVDATQTFLGFSRERDYAPAPDTRTCGTCSGEGKVASGSHVPEYQVRTCPTCNGYGYEPPPGYTANGATAPAPAEHAVASAVPAGPPPDVDEFFEPRILPDGRANPNFGKSPKWKVAVEPWGVTAGLTAQS